MKHGSWKDEHKYDQLIDEILQGKTLEPKHVHRYAHVPREYTLVLEGASYEEIQKYHDRRARIAAGRREYSRKCADYWELNNKLKSYIPKVDLMTQVEISELLYKTEKTSYELDKAIEHVRNKIFQIIELLEGKYNA
jgi:hypothetical protein